MIRISLTSAAAAAAAMAEEVGVGTGIKAVTGVRRSNEVKLWVT